MSRARDIHAATSYASGRWPAPIAAPDPAAVRVALPEPAELSLPLGEALERRASCRRFSGEALSLDVLSALLGAAYGAGAEVDVEGLRYPSRPVPSAGATYPLELHLLARAIADLRPGSYRYAPEEHALVAAGPGARFEALAEIFLEQPYLMPASAVVVITGVLHRTTERYGDRGYRYVLFEAGHAAQNLTLAATALGIGALNLGGFLDDALTAVLRLRPDAVPLYGLALGTPAAGNPGALRER
jgi:SagB-type dehydrogenase family enzyme